MIEKEKKEYKPKKDTVILLTKYYNKVKQQEKENGYNKKN